MVSRFLSTWRVVLGLPNLVSVLISSLRISSDESAGKRRQCNRTAITPEDIRRRGAVSEDRMMQSKRPVQERQDACFRSLWDPGGRDRPKARLRSEERRVGK